MSTLESLITGLLDHQTSLYVMFVSLWAVALIFTSHLRVVCDEFEYRMDIYREPSKGKGGRHSYMNFNIKIFLLLQINLNVICSLDFIAKTSRIR